ncbi:MAG: serine/threonine protein phosphatase [Leptospirales bacterium]|nr:serine/threonine protein phosphatase [Leptospirales bacterium]
MWIIGDIHGCLEELEELLDQIDPSDSLVFLGDYVDRGPDSRGVIERLLREKRRARFVMGNHEAMMLAHLDESGSAEGRSWLHPANGGDATLRSYGLRPGARLEELPASHRAFLQELELYVEGEDWIAVHAGVRNNGSTAMNEQLPEDLLWIREDWIRSESRWRGKKIYYGHTPARYVLGLAQACEPIRGRRSVGLDTGCVYGGALSAMHLPDERLLQARSRGAAQW